MKDSRLVQILKTFTKEETKSFDKFLRSPFLKPSRNTEGLYKYLLKFYPEFDTPKLEREAVFKNLYPGESFNKGILNNLLFDLTNAAEDYITHRTIEGLELDSLMYLSRGYYDKKLLKNSMKVLNQIESKLVKGFSEKKGYLEKCIQICELRKAYYSETADYKKLEEINNQFYELSSLRFLINYTWMISENTASYYNLNKKTDKNIIDSITQYLDLTKIISLFKEFKGELSSLAELHFYILKTIEKPEETDNFKELKEIFYGKIDNYDREEKFSVFNHMLNYCGQVTRSLICDYSKEMFSVYKKMIEYNAFSKSESEYIDSDTYRNIILLTNVYNDEKYLELLVGECKNIVNKEEREDIQSYSKSNLLFMQKKYESSLEMLSGIKAENYVFKLDMKILKLKLFYELNKFESAFSSVDSCRHFIHNTKNIGELTRNNFSNFLRVYSQFIKFRTDPDSVNITELQYESETVSKFYSKNWFKEKTEEMTE